MTYYNSARSQTTEYVPPIQPRVRNEWIVRVNAAKDGPVSCLLRNVKEARAEDAGSRTEIMPYSLLFNLIVSVVDERVDLLDLFS